MNFIVFGNPVYIWCGVLSLFFMLTAGYLGMRRKSFKLHSAMAVLAIIFGILHAGYFLMQ